MQARCGFFWPCVFGLGSVIWSMSVCVCVCVCVSDSKSGRDSRLYIITSKSSHLLIHTETHRHIPYDVPSHRRMLDDSADRQNEYSSLMICCSSLISTLMSICMLAKCIFNITGTIVQEFRVSQFSLQGLKRKPDSVDVILPLNK